MSSHRRVDVFRSAVWVVIASDRRQEMAAVRPGARRLRSPRWGGSEDPWGHHGLPTHHGGLDLRRCAHREDLRRARHIRGIGCQSANKIASPLAIAPSDPCLSRWAYLPSSRRRRGKVHDDPPAKALLREIPEAETTYEWRRTPYMTTPAWRPQSGPDCPHRTLNAARTPPRPRLFPPRGGRSAARPPHSAGRCSRLPERTQRPTPAPPG